MESIRWYILSQNLSWTHHRRISLLLNLPPDSSKSHLLHHFRKYGHSAGCQSSIETLYPRFFRSLIHHLPFFSALPHSRLLSMLVILNLILFFVTSSDSASIVVDQLTSKTESRSVSLKIFWAMFEGLLAALLLIFGGLEALQRATIFASAPILIMTIIALFSLAAQVHRDINKNV